MNIIARLLEAVKPPEGEVRAECPVSGGGHRWLRGGTHDHPHRRICLECELKEGYE